MQLIIRRIDAVLNRFTMYKVVLYGLIVLLIVTDILAFTGRISIPPVGLLLSILVLGSVCYVANELCSRLFRVAANSESYLITALILACILPPASTLSRFLLLGLAGVIAMVSKYVIIWRGSHFLNPAALAAFVMTVSGLLAATWWIATPVLVPFTSLLALVVLHKQRKFTLAFTFGITATLMLLFIGSGLHNLNPIEVVKGAVGSWPIIFMGSIMLTEPSTLPPTRYYQVLVAMLVGVAFSSELHYGNLTATPQTALLLGNLFTLIVAPTFGVLLKLKAINPFSDTLYDVVFEKPKHFTFMPGQYMEFTLAHKGADIRGNRRTFSIASAPSEPELHLGTRRYDPSSTYKKALFSMKPGRYIRAAHVAGNFILPRNSAEPLVLIAGGIGITPFRSMITELIHTKQHRDIVLIYVANTQQDFIYHEDFTAAQSVGVTMHYETGRLTADHLQRLVPDIADRKAYISGPDAMVTGYKVLLRSIGVRRIRTDHFSGY